MEKQGIPVLHDRIRLMADYYPLLSKAVAGLSPNTPEARQGIYDRARLALEIEMMNPAVRTMCY